MKGIRVLKSGIYSTIQDFGRPSFGMLGVPISGAMDQLSASWANILVGNNDDLAV